MKQMRHSQRSIPTWLAWGMIILGVILIVGFIYGIFLYKDIQETKEAGMVEAKQAVLKETDLTAITDITRFNGDESYFAVTGTKKDGTHKLVFVPVNRKTNDGFLAFETKNLVSKQAMQQDWIKNCDRCKLIDIIPAISGKEPLWEVTYTDHSGRHVLDYFSMNNGERVEQLRFRRVFK